MINLQKSCSINADNIIENNLYNNQGSIGKGLQPNLLTGVLEIYTNKNGTISYTNTFSGLSASTVESLAGKTLCFSYEVCTNGSRYSTEQGQTSWDKVRYGIHGACSISGSTNYPFAGELTYSGTAKRCYQLWTIPTGASSYGRLDFSVQNFDKPSSTNNEVWYLRNVKLEVSTYPTAFTLNDYGSNGETLIFDEFIEI